MATMLLRALMICLLASMCNAFGLALSRSSTHSRASILRMSESGPNPVLGIASLGMGLIKPIFKAEAALQATVLSLGSEDVREEARAQIETDRSSAPAVVYTYGLSPFSTECKAFLDKVGCKYEAIELGPEWFLLGPKASAMRVLCKRRRRRPVRLAKERRAGDDAQGCGRALIQGSSGSVFETSDTRRWQCAAATSALTQCLCLLCVAPRDAGYPSCLRIPSDSTGQLALGWLRGG